MRDPATVFACLENWIWLSLLAKFVADEMLFPFPITDPGTVKMLLVTSVFCMRNKPIELQSSPNGTCYIDGFFDDYDIRVMLFQHANEPVIVVGKKLTDVFTSLREFVRAPLGSIGKSADSPPELGRKI